MPDTQRQIAETAFERTQRRDKEINDAMKQERARREAAVKNMFRLRALRVARDEKTKPASHPNRRQESVRT
jgi:nitrate reductase beta subunit